LLVRGKQVRATQAGQALLGHTRQVRLMEADLMAGLQGGTKPARLQSLSVAVNADSLSTWFLPGVAPALQAHGLLLDVVVDDQDHTHEALKSGDVTGCVTTLAQAMRGCVAEPLGVMRYRCMAAPALVVQWSESPVSKRAGSQRLAHCLLGSPAVIFNRKDALQDTFLAQHFGLRDALYPRHFVPAVDAFELALELGMGWGMVPDLLLAARTRELPLQEVLPGCPVDVRLYWQHWARESVAAQRLTQAVKLAAHAQLLQL
ncbi:MAG: HTH-type transcriptional regulator ArgP, partial [Polaromonas sp.]